MSKVAILEPIHPAGIAILKRNNFQVIKIKSQKFGNNIKEINDVEGIVLRTFHLKKEILENCKKLKIVSRHGVGYDNVDINFLNKNNIALTITGSANAVSVAEHVMAMFLSLSKISNKTDHLVRSGKFLDRNSLPDFFEIYKKNVLIIGFGRIGKRLSKICLGFESNVFVYDPYIDESIIRKNNCTPIDFNSGIKIADYISLHLPMNKKTKNLITKKEFKLMKKNCILVNTSRGGIINEKDLYWALSNNIIFGSGIDVFETEPPNQKNLLFKLDNVLLSPHSAALTLECKKRMSIEACENLVYFLKEKNKINIKNVVNKKYIDLNI
tara:strand:- start:203 stop:1180 length:978 start_codon:yes stop_codon:yes gene_type:complete